jgi:hypothetical protein
MGTQKSTAQTAHLLDLLHYRRLKQGHWRHRVPFPVRLSKVLRVEMAGYRGDDKLLLPVLEVGLELPRLELGRALADRQVIR